MNSCVPILYISTRRWQISTSYFLEWLVLYLSASPLQRSLVANQRILINPWRGGVVVTLLHI
ncbi:MAG: hypothetical protein V7K75_03040 [Nostoc sp.]